MIESILIQGAASFGNEPQRLDGLSQLNFLFGSNGAGKTTISRIIADAAKFPSCTVSWKGGTKLESLVYNHDFVERNFHQVTELKGVFTLGEQQKETLDQIAAARAKVDELTQEVEKLTGNLQGADGHRGKRGELTELENAFKEKAWTYKQKFEGKNIQAAFKGSEQVKIVVACFMYSIPLLFSTYVLSNHICAFWVQGHSSYWSPISQLT